jgi:hypothetical protein
LGGKPFSKTINKITGYFNLLFEIVNIPTSLLNDLPSAPIVWRRKQVIVDTFKKASL